MLPRFGLRSLFVLALFFCLLFGWIGRNVYRVRQEEAAVETLLQAGASVSSDDWASDWPHELTRNEWDEIASGKTISGWLGRIQGQSVRPQLRSVVLGKSSAKESELRAAAAVLPRLPELEHVSLNGPAFDDAASEYLAQLPHLEYVSLARTHVTEQGLQRLALLPRLRRIDLSAPDGSPLLLSELPSLVRLRHVRLMRLSVTRADMEGIASLPQLEVLELASVKTEDDQALDPLENAERLRLLAVASGIPNERQFAFENLRNLEWLEVPLEHEETLDRLVGLSKLGHINVRETLDREAVRLFSAKRRGCIVLQSQALASWIAFRNGKRLDPVELRSTLLNRPTLPTDD